MTPPLRVAFFGSPDFAVPVLDRLLEEHEVRLVVARPDAPAGRGLAVRRPPVARRADEAGVPVAQPTRLRGDEEFRARLAAEGLDVAVTTAYGAILPRSLLEVPRHGFLNAHASLLPELRGAAPVQWALIRGYARTGVTVMQTDVGMDTGPIRYRLETEIGPDETAPELFARLAPLSARAISEALALLARGDLPSTPQDDARATAAPLLTKEDGHLDWSDPAPAVHDRWRGVLAWPGARFAHDGRRVRVDRMRLVARDGSEGAPGTVLGVAPDGVTVACGAGRVRLERVTPPGRPSVDAGAWAHGAHLKEGDRLA